MLVTHRRWPRTIAVLAAACLPVVFACGLSLAQDNTKQSAPVETAAQKFKNIKVLKDLPADQLIPVMRKFNAALGVKCDACHVINPDHSGFEKDDKPMKETARQMIVMVGNINKNEKSLHGSATCYMCHHGSPEPQRMPPAETKPAEAKPAPEKPAEPKPRR